MPRFLLKGTEDMSLKNLHMNVHSSLMRESQKVNPSISQLMNG